MPPFFQIYKEQKRNKKVLIIELLFIQQGIIEVPMMLKMFFIGLLCCSLTLASSSASEHEQNFCSNLQNGDFVLNNALDGIQGKMMDDVIGDLIKKGMLQKGSGTVMEAVKPSTGLKIEKAKLSQAALSFTPKGKFLQGTSTITITGSLGLVNEDIQGLNLWISLSLVNLVRVTVGLDDAVGSIKLVPSESKIVDANVIVTADKSGVDLDKIKNIVKDKLLHGKATAPLISLAAEKMVRPLSKAVNSALVNVPLEVLGDNPAETVSSWIANCFGGKIDFTEFVPKEQGP
ncbi:uncharacterized protein LOC115476261 [Microcaecilia unicolor]|uniref:Uncharacterized protein LOC115476261 n=1 Tax=Microcaecilia unicolor TaxID=1415580 RepID=A0A6P7YY49_9AMPH|nr:uncharacterized protein LOC115476261 [Microcaecilia unicolor]